MGKKRNRPPQQKSRAQQSARQVGKPGTASAPAAQPELGSQAEFRLPCGLDWLLVLLPAACVALHPLYSNDLPLHLGVGEWILTNGTLPAVDPFSFTAGENTAWVPHEWLVGILFAIVEHASGAGGLTLLLVLGAVLLAFVLRGMTRALNLSSSTFLLWSLPLWVMLGRRIILRPHLFAIALPFLLWWILLRAREKPRLLWSIPLVMMLWVNIHGSFLLGFGIIGLDLIVCGAGHPIPWRTRIIALATSGATLLTQVHIYFQPDLLAGVKHAFGIVRDPVFTQAVVEWRAPFSNETFQQTFAFKISLVWIALATWGFFKKGASIPLSYRLFVLVTLVLYLRHQRFLLLFAPASLALMPFPTKLGLGQRWHLAARVLALAAAVIFLYPGYPVGRSKGGNVIRAAGVGWSPELPVDVLERGMLEFPNNLLREYPGIFCEYGFGGTLMWKGRAEFKPTMDGRNSVYTSDLYLKHREALEKPTPYREKLLEEVGAVLIGHPAVKPARQNMIDRLVNDPRWSWELTTPKPNEPYLLFLKHRR